jgi:hypothetical protein
MSNAWEAGLEQVIGAITKSVPRFVILSSKKIHCFIVFSSCKANMTSELTRTPPHRRVQGQSSETSPLPHRPPSSSFSPPAPSSPSLAAQPPLVASNNLFARPNHHVELILRTSSQQNNLVEFLLLFLALPDSLMELPLRHSSISPIPPRWPRIPA